MRAMRTLAYREYQTCVTLMMLLFSLQFYQYNKQYECPDGNPCEDDPSTCTQFQESCGYYQCVNSPSEKRICIQYNPIQPAHDDFATFEGLTTQPPLITTESFRTTDSTPVTTEPIPFPTDSTLITIESMPITTETSTTTKPFSTTESIPITAETISIATKAMTWTTEQIPIATDESSATISDNASSSRKPSTKKWKTLMWYILQGLKNKGSKNK